MFIEGELIVNVKFLGVCVLIGSGIILIAVSRGGGKVTKQGLPSLPDKPIPIAEAMKNFADFPCQEDTDRKIIKITVTITKANIENAGTKVACINAYVIVDGRILTDHPNVIIFVPPKSTKEVTTLTGGQYAYPFNRFISVSSLNWK